MRFAAGRPGGDVMTDSISDQMMAAAVTQAEQIAVNQMNRDAAFARHTAQAMDLVAGPFVADDDDVLRLDDRGWTS